MTIQGKTPPALLAAVHCEIRDAGFFLPRRQSIRQHQGRPAIKEAWLPRGRKPNVATSKNRQSPPRQAMRAQRTVNQPFRAPPVSLQPGLPVGIGHRIDSVITALTVDGDRPRRASRCQNEKQRHSLRRPAPEQQRYPQSQNSHRQPVDRQRVQEDVYVFGLPETLKHASRPRYLDISAFSIMLMPSRDTILPFTVTVLAAYCAASSFKGL